VAIYDLKQVGGLYTKRCVNYIPEKNLKIKECNQK